MRRSSLAGVENPGPASEPINQPEFDFDSPGDGSINFHRSSWKIMLVSWTFTRAARWKADILPWPWA